MISKLQTILDASEKHKKVFNQQPLVAFRHATNLKGNLVRDKLPHLQIRIIQGCFRCGTSRREICKFMLEDVNFRCGGSGREFKIISRFTCDSSEVVYLLGCRVCGKRYVDSTYTPFRARFNKYKSKSLGFLNGNQSRRQNF